MTSHEYRTKGLNPGSKSKPGEIRNVNFLVHSPLVERKQRLREILPKNSQSVLFCDHIEASRRHRGEAKFGPYLEDAAQWFKIRNRKYSQWAGREKFFEREREVDPDMTVWDSCVLACEQD